MYFNNLEEGNPQPAPEGDSNSSMSRQISSSDDPESVLRYGWAAYFKKAVVFLFWHKLAVLLVFLPIALICKASNASESVMLVMSMLALVPLASMLGDITEQLALHTNETIGGLLNATFGNATEAIVSIFAIRGGQLRLVQVSLVGSVLSNLLLVLGCAFLAGGIKYKEQKINMAVTVTSTGLLFLVAVCLSIVTIMKESNSLVTAGSELALSRAISVMMLIGYVLFLYFQLKTHLHLFEDAEEEPSSPNSSNNNSNDNDNNEEGGNSNSSQSSSTPPQRRRNSQSHDVSPSLSAPLNDDMHDVNMVELSTFSNSSEVVEIPSDEHEIEHEGAGSRGQRPHLARGPSSILVGNAEELNNQNEDGAEDDDDDEEEEKILGPWGGIICMFIVTIFISILSEYIVDAIQGAAEGLKLQEIFIGTILLPIVGNAAEHASAVTVAYKNKINLAMGVAIGSSIQIALFVIPLMVVVAALAGQPLSLDFHAFEMACMYSSVVLVGFMISDGRANWLKGALLLFLYFAIAAAFYYHKDD